MREIRVYGTRWCFDTTRALRILDRNQVRYEWIDIDKDLEAEKYVKAVNDGYRSVPTIVFPDGSILVEPPNFTLEEKLRELKA